MTQLILESWIHEILPDDLRWPIYRFSRLKWTISTIVFITSILARLAHLHSIVPSLPPCHQSNYSFKFHLTDQFFLNKMHLSFCPRFHFFEKSPEKLLHIIIHIYKDYCYYIILMNILLCTIFLLPQYISLSCLFSSSSPFLESKIDKKSSTWKIRKEWRNIVEWALYI